jgi:hypothetical protein
MSLFFRPVLGMIMLLALYRPAAADVISDWNEKVISFAIARGWGTAELRVLAITDLAMFDAVNAVERHRPYLMNFVVTGPTSKEDAAASRGAVWSLAENRPILSFLPIPRLGYNTPVTELGRPAAMVALEMLTMRPRTSLQIT